jgi:hypothetical protein
LEPGGNSAACLAKPGRLNQLLVDEIYALGQPALHPMDLVFVGTPSRFETPSSDLARLGFAHFVGEPVNQAEQIRFGKIRPAQSLPPVHSELPEIRIAEQPGPPWRVEEPACVPASWIGVSMISRSKGAVKIPVRAESDLSTTRFVDSGSPKRASTPIPRATFRPSP